MEGLLEKGGNAYNKQGPDGGEVGVEGMVRMGEGLDVQ